MNELEWKVIRDILSIIKILNNPTMNDIIQELSNYENILKMRTNLGDEATINRIQVIIEELINNGFVKIKKYSTPKMEFPLNEYAITYNGLLLIDYLKPSNHLKHLTGKTIKGIVQLLLKF